MTVETWKAIFDWGTVVLLGFTFVFGAGALITGGILSERQEKQALQFEKDLTEAKTNLSEQQERAANAEITLHRLQAGRLTRSLLLAFHSQKEIDSTLQSLRNTPGRAEILFAKGDAEAHSLAEEVFGLLRASNWQVTKPEEVPAVDVVEKLRAQPLGVTIVAKTITEPNNPQYSILRQVFNESLDGVYGGSDLGLPPNLLRIVIMPRP
jgi:hypothetical protein